MIGAVGGIDDGESGLAGEAKDFHFCLMDFGEGFGAIDHIDDSRALDDGFEEVAFSGEGIVSVVFGEESAKDGQGVFGGRRKLKNIESGERILEAWGIVESEKIFEMKELADHRFASGGADADLIIFGEGGENGRFAVIDGSDDGEGGDGKERGVHGFHFSRLRER